MQVLKIGNATMENLLLVLAAAYLLGAVPWSYLIARWAGQDIYRLGDGNVGAHNVMRNVGRGWGTLALALDAGKGALAVALAGALDAPAWLPVAAGLAAVVGHNYPFWLAGRGGKGLATSLGVVIALFPALAWLIISGGVVLIVLTKNLAFSGVAVGLLLAVAAAMLGLGPVYTLAPLGLLALTALKQWPDLRRDWQQTPDKRDLVLNRWIRDRDARR